MCGRFKVAITDSIFDSHRIEKRILSEIGAELVEFQCRKEDEVIEYCSHVDGLLVMHAPITRKVVESLNARVITRYGVGVDNIDVQAATERNILVTNVIYDTTDVADHTVGMITSMIRRIPWIMPSTRRGEWDWRRFKPINRLKGKTIGILGFGRIGRQVAQRLRGFEVELIAHDPYQSSEVFEETGVKRVDLGTLLTTSNIITIHVALTEETYHVIGKKELYKMRNDALLINVSRGGVIDENALYLALKRGLISGAALDVLEQEPVKKDNPLLALKNVIITPHIAWYSESSVDEIHKAAAEDVVRALMGQTPKYLVNKDVLQR